MDDLPQKNCRKIEKKRIAIKSKLIITNVSVYTNQTEFHFFLHFVYCSMILFFAFSFFAKNYKFVIFSGLLHKKLKIVQLLLLKRWLPNQSWRLTILLKILDGIIVVEVIGLFIIIPNRQLKNANKRMKKNQ